MHPEIKRELDNLAIQFGNRAVLTLSDYAELYSIDRQHAGQHLHRRGIPFAKEGRQIYISTLDLAAYRAKRKATIEKRVIIEPFNYAEEMKARRGGGRRKGQL
jgi:hypothetical protein